MGKKYPKKEFKLIDIRKMYAGSLEKDGDNEQLSDFEVRATAYAYLLYVFASVIFPDNKVNRVSANLLQLLDPLEDVSKYSWGNAIIAHLNAQLEMASRERTSQMNGNLVLLQVWVYEHFPSLFKGDEDIQLQPTWNNTKPRGTRYNYTGSQDKEEAQKLKLLAMRQKLDNMIAKEVTFDPYKEDRVGGLEDLAYYHGPLFYPCGYSMYNPHRVMRHLGYIQDSPDEYYVPPFKYKLKKCKADKKALVVAYEPEPKTKHWNNRHLGSRVEISWWDHVNEGHEVSGDYIPWYEGFSHGRVIRIDQTTGRRSNKASSAASTVDTRDDSSILKLVAKGTGEDFYEVILLQSRQWRSDGT
ncbi:protein MAINTENANCE OF MERISTEMS-like isoform X2 [Papaver somniferum]|uniref:protein MAINTENANCE OF MERISTEMS-like isoform X2 n=1 Tax=Papaver somniferum TaxID=3469 RepID=UPI000E6FA3C9|nr:protein MAINTENANCE OF MERISTEMS-like isoform X2 [Papaver somniferum]